MCVSQNFVHLIKTVFNFFIQVMEYLDLKSPLQLLCTLFFQETWKSKSADILFAGLKKLPVLIKCSLSSWHKLTE